MQKNWRILNKDDPDGMGWNGFTHHSISVLSYPVAIIVKIRIELFCVSLASVFIILNIKICQQC